MRAPTTIWMAAIRYLFRGVWAASQTAQSFMMPFVGTSPMMEVIPSPPRKKKAPMAITGAKMRMAKRKPSVR